MAISAVAGPITNILIALASFILVQFILTPLTIISPAEINDTVMKPLLMIFSGSIYVNVIFAFVNLIPIPPLDGGRVLAGILPAKHAYTFDKIEPFGIIIVLVLFYTGIASFIISPFIRFFLTIFGMHY